MKKLFSSGKRRRIGAIILGMAVILAIGASIFGSRRSAAVETSLAEKPLPIYSVERDGKFVSLSFDAAWGNVIYGTYS